MLIQTPLPLPSPLNNTNAAKISALSFSLFLSLSLSFSLCLYLSLSLSQLGSAVFTFSLFSLLSGCSLSIVCCLDCLFRLLAIFDGQDS